MLESENDQSAAWDVRIEIEIPVSDSLYYQLYPPVMSQYPIHRFPFIRGMTCPFPKENHKHGNLPTKK